MHTKRHIYLFLIAALLSALPLNATTPEPAHAATILRVIETGLSSGSCGGDWATNACDLQNALSQAVSGDEIWVAAGTYRPTASTDRAATFQLKTGVALYGGFAGTETLRSERDWAANVTTLSGDIGTLGNAADNSYHVVTGNGTSATAVLDGFTILGGNANGSSIHSAGGGMYNDSGSPTVMNVFFRANSATYGGGMYNTTASPAVTNVVFSGNSATYGGGGMYNSGPGNPVLTNVTFSSNSATTYGGAIYKDAGSPALANSILWGNTAGSAGAQIHQIGASTVTATYSDIQGGWTGTGNIDADPLFVDADGADNIPGTADDNLRLQPGSPAMDAGNNAAVPAGVTTDLDGAPRISNDVVDMGAYEFQHVSGNQRWYVNAEGAAGSGCASWADACPDLQTALGQAVAGDEIWVAAGTYRPDASSGNRAATFQLKTGVALYGGFVGTETQRSERDWVANVSTLSGDIGTLGDNADNSYHVVTGSGTDATTVLDGFTITAGNANGSDPHNAGGGMHNTSGSPTVTNITFDGNSAQHGGGIFNDDSSSPSVANATISNNSAAVGGGMHNDNFSNPTVTDVTFSGNSATYGGGMKNDRSSHPTLTNVSFTGNSATLGGGMHNTGASSPTLTNVTFSGNLAEHGGGIYNLDASHPVLTNVTFKSNSAVSFGGGIYNSNSSPEVRNSILWDNTAPSGGAQIYDDNSTPSVSASVVQGGYASGTNILTDDPLLGMVDDYGGATHTMPLLPGSSAIDAANTNCPTTDQRGIARGTTCDLGAFESRGFVLTKTGGDNQSTFVNTEFPDLLSLSVASAHGEPVDGGRVTFSAPVSGASTNPATNTATIANGVVSQSVIANGTPGSYSVTADANGADGEITFALNNYPEQIQILYAKPGGLTNGPCDSWTNACELRYGLTSSIFGQEIWVMAGTYTPDASGDRAATFQLKSGLAIYGGFAGTETLRSERDWTANVTVLSGDIGTLGDNADNSYHVVTGSGTDTTAALDGFTITGGHANGNSPHNAGGGMTNSAGSPTLTNLIFGDNLAQYGGGMHNSNASNPTLTNVTFSGNSADQGGGIHNNASSPTLTNITLSGNAASSFGGGIYNNAGSPTLANSILWGNSAGTDGAQIYEVGSQSVSATYSDIQGGWIGSGNIDANPLFVDANGADDIPGTADDNLRLQPGSPPIDAGNNAAVPAGVTTDLDGALRIWNGAVDMGAYERHPWFVDDDGAGGNGCTSWSDACPDLQTALGRAVAGDEIWVAVGTYKPTASTDRTITFQLTTGVALYGGFDGSETLRSERDWAANVTVLSGDIGTLGDTADNSYHVVTGSGTDATAVLDGFAITAGRAGGSAPHHSGGGMVNDAGSPTVTNSTFSANLASVYGGGMSNHNGSSPALTNVTFSGNSAITGGGISNDGASNPMLTNVTFNGNWSSFYGGGMSNHGASSPTLTNVTFNGNGSGSDGGGIHNFGSSNPTLTDVTFTNNRAYRWGGGMENDYNSSPTLTNVIFVNNRARDYGGGMDNDYNSSPSLTNVTFSGNSAVNGGGMYNYDHSSPTLIDVTFSGNSADYGGGIGSDINCSPTLTNVTFSGNSANQNGGALYNSSGSTPTLTNSILWGNTAVINGPQIYNDSSTPVVAYSDIQDAFNASNVWDVTLGTDGGGNLDAAPLFVDADGADNISGTADDNLRLQPGSPAIDAGSNDRLPADTADLDGDGDTTELIPFDLAGNPRIVNSMVDMGAYEVPVVTTSVAMAPGWNLLALPLHPLNTITAQSLLDAIHDAIHTQGGACSEVDRWLNGGWDAHIDGLPFNDFAIEPGNGYFLKCTTVSQWTLQGYAFTAGVPIALQPGWNLIGVPHPVSIYTAQSLLDAIASQGGGCSEVDRWLNGGWDAHIGGLPFNDFGIEPDQGYFVRCSSASTFVPGPLTNAIAAGR